MALSAGHTANIKVVLIGDGAVGKTTLVKAFIRGRALADTSYRRTIGADIYVKEIKHTNPLIGDIFIKFIIWDLAGQPSWRIVRPQYYVGAQAGIAVFDVSRPVTLRNLSYWVAEFYSSSGGPKPIVIVGNKIDLREKMQCVPPSVGEKYAKALAERFNVFVEYLEASAINYLNVDKVFAKLADILIETYLRKKQSKT